MRRLLLLTLGLVLALSLVPGAGAGISRYLSADKDFVSLKSGKGVAAFSVRGVLYGSFARGRIRITDLPAGPATTISVWGAERVIRINGRATVYVGTDVHFRIERGAWRARIHGRGINASAVLEGVVTLSRGEGGVYSIEGGKPRKWPLAARTFRLGD